MMMIVGIAFLILVLLQSTQSFTRDARSVAFWTNSEDGSTRSALYDVIVGRSSLFEQRSMLNQDNYLYLDKLLLVRSIERIRFALERLASDVVQKTGSGARWLHASPDRSLIDFNAEKISEVSQLHSGMIVPSVNCREPESHGCRQCAFARLVQSYRIYPPIPFATLNMVQWSYLFEFADDLFNAQLYDHAQAWTCHLLTHLEVGYSEAADIEAVVASMTVAQHKLLLRGSLILSEIARLKGDLDTATQHAVRMVHSHHALARAGEEHANFGVLARLRVLLTIPPVPPDPSTAARYRLEMLDDLRAFSRNLQENGITLPLADLSAHVSATPFNMAHQGLNDLDFQQALRDTLVTLCPELLYTAPHLLPEKGHQSDQNVQRSLSPSERWVVKVGFVSTFFIDHSIGRILTELLVFLNQLRLSHAGQEVAFQVFAYHIDRRLPSDTSVQINGSTATLSEATSQQLYEDVITRALAQHLGHQAVRLPDNCTTVRTVLSAAELDVLAFTDVGMEFSTYQLAFSRFAPLQVAWWGHPITTGLPSIDYFLSLEDEVDGAQDHYTEQLVRMRHINTVPLAAPYSYRLKRTLYVSGEEQGMEGQEEERFLAETARDEAALQALGFTLQTQIVMVLGRLFKLHPEFDQILASLIWRLAVEEATDSAQDGPYIVLIAEAVDELNSIVYNRLLTALTAKLRGEGVKEDRVERLLTRYVKVVGYGQYHTLLRTALVVLDTFPYGGCLTSHDALSHAVPLVTLPSEFIRGRFSLGLYREMNMTSLIATSSEKYVDIVLRLIRDHYFWLECATEIKAKFLDFAGTNNMKVAQEWGMFLLSAL